MLISFYLFLPCHISTKYALKCYLGLFSSEESWAHPLPPNYKPCLLLVQLTLLFRIGDVIA
jgi:hypothetical protein